MSIIDIDLTESIHKAAQYLAAAGINYLEPRINDGHTNLGWDNERKAFITRNLNGNALYLSLNLTNYRLEFLRNGMVLASKPVTGSRHHEIIDWLSEVFRDLNFPTPFRYKFHYELPYNPVQADYVHESIDTEILGNESNLREKAYTVLNKISKNFDENNEVRTWPHHFDTATTITLGGEYNIGIGMAMPDNLMDEYYFYASAWKGEAQMPVSNLPALKNGKWLSDTWNGAVISATLPNAKIEQFFKEVIDYLSSPSLHSK